MVPVSRALGLKDPAVIGSNPWRPQEIAALSSVVQREAQTGNRFARQLCNEAGRELAELALALIRRFGWQRRAANVMCAGGVFRASATIRRSFARQLHASAPKARVALLKHDAVEGALRLARDLL